MSASLQMAECWHPISMATRCSQQQRASFHGDRCAGSSAPGMLNAEVGRLKGFHHRFSEDFAPRLSRRPKDREKRSVPETFVTPLVSWDHRRRTGALQQAICRYTGRSRYFCVYVKTTLRPVRELRLLRI